MNRRHTTLPAVIAMAAALSAAFGVHAEALGQHPGVLAHRASQAIDPNTFIVAHPAQPTVQRGHTGHEHPALSARRDAAVQGIDANTFLVQPPASTTWTQGVPHTLMLAASNGR